uniref:RNase H type-1 domain-containing protein n=1 Tax=Chenopodium quinoa TaxID=63459 RepID=A0A803LFU9_CHEQI
MMVQSICCEFKATNNEVEYEALIAGMNLAKDLGASRLQVFCDSFLVASQMNEELAAKDSKMILYLDLAKSLPTKFATFSIKQIPRA